MKLKDIVQYAHEKHMLQLLPVPVALSIRSFFMMWHAFGECPAFFMREKVMTARLQDEHCEKPYAVVIELRETIAHAARETVLEKICTENFKVFHSILSYLDQSGNGCTALFGVKAVWEVGGWIPAGSDEAEVCTAFIMACKDRGIDTAPGCSEDAFVEGFPHMLPKQFGVLAFLEMVGGGFLGKCWLDFQVDETPHGAVGQRHACQEGLGRVVQSVL